MPNKHQIMIKVIKPDENNYKILNHNSTDLHEISTNYDIHFNSHFNSETYSKQSDIKQSKLNKFNSKETCINSINNSIITQKCKQLKYRSPKELQVDYSSTVCTQNKYLKCRVKSPKSRVYKPLILNGLQNRPFSAPRKRETKKSNNTWIFQNALKYSRKRKLSIAYSSKPMQKTIAKIKEHV